MNDKQIDYRIKSFTLIKRGFVLGFLIILSSCLSIKPGSVKSGKKLYETFFIGEAGTQYFIKPLTFSNNLNEELKLDITFRYRNEIKDTAIINISFLGKEIFKNADSLEINNEAIAIIIKEMKYMFCERNKEIFNCRFSAKVKLLDVEKLFDSSKWNLILYKNGDFSEYLTPKTTEKKIDKLNYEIFAIF
jgi:hypothetical protein